MKKNLGNLLVENGLITEKVLAEALQRQVIFGGRLGTNLLEMGAVSEESLLKVLSHQFKVPYAEDRHFKNIPPQVLQSIPREILEKHGVVPLSVEKNRVTLAMKDPTAFDIIDEISFHTNKVIVPVIAIELRIAQALEKLYGIKREARYIAASADVLEEQKKVQEAAKSEIPAVDEEIIDADIEIIDRLDLEEINDSFFNVRNRDDVAQSVIRAALRVMDDVFMFILKGDDVISWMAGGSLKPPKDFGQWQRKLEPGSMLDQVRESRTVERATGDVMFAANPWMREFSTKVPTEVFVCPLVLKRRAVAALLGFSWQSRLTDEEVEFLVRIMRKASVAFEILILRSRILML